MGNKTVYSNLRDCDKEYPRAGGGVAAAGGRELGG